MSQSPHPLYGLLRSSLITHSLGLLGGLGLLSSGAAFAQTDTFVDTLGSTPPAPTTPAVQPTAPQLNKAPKTTEAVPAPAAVSTPKPLPAPQVSVPPRPTSPSAIPDQLRDTPPVVTNTPARQTQNYVDQTQYRSPHAATPPPNVVIRDRASEQAKPTSTRPGVPPNVAIPSPLNQPPRPLARRGVPPLSPRSGQSQPGLRRVVPESLSLPKLINNALKRPAPYPNNGNRGLLFPLGIPADISSVFGWRVHPIHGDWRMHTGTDLAAPQGTPVLAAYHGEVAIADYVGGYGNMVVLRHEDGTQESRYAHLSHIFVRPGEWVEQGDVIGLVGSTGNSTGPHLHFEWRHWYANNWVPVDAGAQLAWALAEMRQTMVATMTPEERSQVELGQMAWNSATLFLSPEGETAEVQAETAGAIAPSATELGNKAAESLTNGRSLKPQALYYIEQDAPDQPLRVKPSPALTNPAIQP